MEMGFNGRGYLHSYPAPLKGLARFNEVRFNEVIFG